MAAVVVSGDTSGSVTLAAPAVAGSTTQNLVAVSGTLAPVVSGTAVASTSGTTIDFTGIPSWAKRITVMFNGVSGSGTSNLLIQLGTAGGFTTSGYRSTASQGTSTATSTAGFILTASLVASDTSDGLATICALGSNAWSMNSVVVNGGANTNRIGGGGVTLGGALTQVRITTVNGTDTFDAGTINILYE